MPRFYVGTSGWNYRHWRDSFYGDTPQREWLAFAARRFPALEINASFYRLQKADTLAHWREATPAAFRFALKANRYLTHSRRLREPREPVAKERDNAAPLGDRLGVVLWQLPANLDHDMDRLAAFLDALGAWPSVRHAIEFRHASWFTDAVADALGAHGVASVQSDAADWPLWEAVTTDLVYLRLHGHTRTYASAYGGAHLDRWAAAIRGWLDEGRTVYAFFDNDAEGAAPRDVQRLRERMDALAT